MSKTKYPKNFLNEVIFKIEFPPILELYNTKKESAAKFQEIIFKEFGDAKFNTNKHINVKLDNEGIPIGSDSEENLIWSFFNKDDKRVELSATSLALIYKGSYYTTFEDFSEDVDLILKGLKSYPITQIKYIGLRYINQIDIRNYENLDDYINPNLHLINKEFDEKLLIQSLSRVELSIEDYILAFQFGHFNPEYPNISSNKDFILDYDCYLKGNESFENIKSDLLEMNEIIYNQFEKSLEQELRKIMGNSDDY
ncbi:TIGR04255 family protein [Methanobrevibacter sp.]|uniref:TIGR04255 family protein n=1 Tax=Methanobrevibacter sp. TaxID=66852 RepID=UPI0025CEE9CD|nr:TIGR04255 family protein [Methanobrevibacter sp.]MBQ2962731.1 TIGR04255 family protein [Methanobrevibacter sp.]